MYYPDYPYYQNYYQLYSYLPKYGYNTAFSHQAASSPQCQVGLGKQPQRKQKETAALQGGSSSQSQLLGSSASSSVYSQNQLVLDRQENKESDLYKQQIVQWLKSMDIDQRFEVFMIKDKWFAQTITKMYWKQKTGEFSAFALYSEEDKKDRNYFVLKLNSRNTNKIVELDSQFYCRKCIDHDSVSNAPRREAEQEIVKVLRIIDDKEIYDSLVFDKAFLDNIDHLIDVFDVVSDNNIFQTSHFSQYSWFHQNTFQTIACWIVSQFERMVQYKFIEDRQRYHQKLGRQPQGLISSSTYSSSNQNKESNKSDEKLNEISGIKLNGNNSSTADSSSSETNNGNCSQSKNDSNSCGQNGNNNNNSNSNNNMTNQGYSSFNIDSHSNQENLSHYQSLLQYWRSMNSSKKRKILNKGSEIHKTLISQSQIEGLDKNDKQLEWYKKTKDQFYLKQKLPNDEEIQQNLLQFLDEQKAEKFIDQLCFTSLDDTTNVITIILKKLHEKLNEMYSDQIAQYLIHNDELEKSVKKKKNNTQNQGSQNGAKKKKKNVKTKSKSNSGGNNGTNSSSQPPIKETTFAEEVSLMHQQEILQDQQEKLIQQQLQQIHSDQQKQTKQVEKETKLQVENLKQEDLDEKEDKSSSLENSKKCDNQQANNKQATQQISKKKAAISSMPLVLKMQQQQKKNEYLEVCCQQNKCEMIDMTKSIAQRLVSNCIQIVDTFSSRNENIDSKQELNLLKKDYETDNQSSKNTNNSNQNPSATVNGNTSQSASKKKKKSKNQNISSQSNNNNSSANGVNSSQNLKQKQTKNGKQEILADKEEDNLQNDNKQVRNNPDEEDTEELPHPNYSDSDQDGAKKGSEIHSDNTTIDCQYRMCSAITISSSSKRKQSDSRQSNSSSRHTTKNINHFSDEDDFKNFNDQINQVNSNKKNNTQKTTQSNGKQQIKQNQNEKLNQNTQQTSQQNKNLRQGNHKTQDRKNQQNNQEDAVLEKEIYSLTISQNNDLTCNSSIERGSLVSSRSSSQAQVTSQMSLNHQNSISNNNNSNMYSSTPPPDDSDFIQVSGRKKNHKNQQQGQLNNSNNNRKNQNNSNVSGSNNNNLNNYNNNQNSNRQNGRKNNNNNGNNNLNNNNKNQNRRNNRNEKQIQGDGRQNNHQLIRNNRNQDDQQIQTKENSVVSQQSQQQINEEEEQSNTSTQSRFTQKSSTQQKEEQIVSSDLTSNNTNKQTNQHSKSIQINKKPQKIIQKQVVINTIDILTSKEEESPDLKLSNIQQQQQQYIQSSPSLNLQSQFSQDSTQAAAATAKQNEIDSQRQENQQPSIQLQQQQSNNINTKITSTIVSNSTNNQFNNNTNSQENSNFCQQQTTKQTKLTLTKRQKLQQKSPLTLNSDKFQVREEYIQKSQLIQQQQQQQQKQQNNQTQQQQYPKDNIQTENVNQMSPTQTQASPTINTSQSQTQGQNGNVAQNQATQPQLKKKQMSNRKKSGQNNNGQGGNVQESYVAANPQQRKNKNGTFQNQWKDSNDANHPPVVHQTLNSKAKSKIAKRLFRRKINNDILSFTEMINIESSRHQPSRFLIFQRIQHLLKKQFHYEKVESQVDLRIFGSCATGLSLPTSDIDLGITGFEYHPRSDLIYVLNQLANILEQFKWVKSLERIFTASIPIIKMEVDPFIDFKECKNQEELSQFLDPSSIQNLNLIATEENQDLKGIHLKVDITVECQMQSPNTEILNHMGQYSTDFVVRWMGYYVRLQPMTILMKCFLHARNLNTNFKGGISSYCLLIMIIAFFRYKQSISQSDDYSKILSNFLQFYGTIFKPETTAISLMNGDFIPCVRNPSQSKLQVVDPLTCKIMTQNTYLIDEILKEFQIFYNKLNDFNKKVEKQLDKMTYEQIERLDHMDFEQQKEELNRIFEKNIIESIIYEVDNSKTELYEKIFKQEQQEHNKNIQCMNISDKKKLVI